ncbi:MAG: threonine aldolase [Verrucomicrobiota bacterium]
MTAEQRHEFASDNTATICPEAKLAFDLANRGSAAAYGDDQWTKRLCNRVCELFENECHVSLVFNGTAANALALGQLCQPFHSILCHEYAHINTDECGACEFFTGGSKLISIRGEDGKLDLQEIEAAVARQHGVHSHKPRVISLTQATELGTIYTVDEVREIYGFAQGRGMLLHMDGARFANAVATLRCSPKALTWQSGIDVLCLGGTKNGLAAGELVIFFDKAKAGEFEYRVKQGGQLGSKTRFFAAPWLGLLEHEVWLKNASHANASAQKLAAGLERNGAEIVFPTQANAVFVRLDDAVAKTLSELGWSFYKFIEPDVYRLMCSWSTTEEQIAAFIQDFKAAKSCAAAVS